MELREGELAGKGPVLGAGAEAEGGEKGERVVACDEGGCGRVGRLK